MKWNEMKWKKKTEMKRNEEKLLEFLITLEFQYSYELEFCKKLHK